MSIISYSKLILVRIELIRSIVWPYETKYFFVVSFLFMTLFSVFRGGYFTIFELNGVQMSALFGSVFYFFFTAWLVRRYRGIIKPFYIVFPIGLGVYIITIPFTVLYFKETLGTLPCDLIWWLGMILGAVFSRMAHRVRKILPVIFSMLLLWWLSVPGYSKFNHWLSFGTSSGKIETLAIETERFCLTNANGEEFTLTSLPEKYIVLDLWIATCGSCFEAFPEVQLLYDSYKGNPEVGIYAVYCGLEEKQERYPGGIRLLQEEGYSFPCFSTDLRNSFLREDGLGVMVFPTVLIFDKGRNIIFRGNIKTATKFVKKLL